MISTKHSFRVLAGAALVMLVAACGQKTQVIEEPVQPPASAAVVEPAPAQEAPATPADAAAPTAPITEPAPAAPTTEAAPAAKEASNTAPAASAS